MAKVMNCVARQKHRIRNQLYGNTEKVYYHLVNIGLRITACVLLMVENGKQLKQFDNEIFHKEMEVDANGNDRKTD